MSLAGTTREYINFVMMNNKTAPLLKTLARHMRERRKSLRLTQEQLADRSGLSPNYIAKLEMEKRIPSVGALTALADALEVEVSELLSQEAGTGSTDAAEESARVVKRLRSEDAEFVLDVVRLVAGHVDHLREAG